MQFQLYLLEKTVAEGLAGFERTLKRNGTGYFVTDKVTLKKQRRILKWYYYGKNNIQDSFAFDEQERSADVAAI